MDETYTARNWCREHVQIGLIIVTIDIEITASGNGIELIIFILKHHGFGHEYVLFPNEGGR